MEKKLSYRIVAIAGLIAVILHVITYRRSPIRREFDLDFSDPILVILVVIEIILLIAIAAIVLIASRKRGDGR